MAVDTAQLDPVGPIDSPAARTATEGTKAAHEPPLLEPAPHGPAERFAHAVGAGHPVRVFLAAAVGGYLLLVGFMILLGLLLTRVILQIDGVSSWDESISSWLARHRTPALVDLSWVGSTFAGGVVIPVFVGGMLLLFCLHRRWRLAAFTLFVICIESGTYRATSLVIHRDRPDVERLETLPVDASYPSGHTAASLALYSGLLLVLISRVERLALRVMLASLAVAIPVFVGWSRMLRGMHHLTDTFAGVVLGLLALAVAVFAARAAGAAASAQRDAAR